MPIIKPAGIYLKYTTWENDYDHVKEEFTKVSNLAKAKKWAYMLTTYGISGSNNKLGLANRSDNHKYIEAHVTANETDFTFDELVDTVSDLAGSTYNGDIRVTEGVQIVEITNPWEYKVIST